MTAALDSGTASSIQRGMGSVLSKGAWERLDDCPVPKKEYVCPLLCL